MESVVEGKDERRPILVESCLLVNPCAEAIEELKRRYGMLGKNGVDIKFLTYPRKKWGDRNLSCGQFLEDAMPGSVVYADDSFFGENWNDAYVTRMSWPRDLFSLIGKNVWAYKKIEPIVRDLLAQLKVDDSRIKFSDTHNLFAEGGFHILNKKTLLMAGFIGQDGLKEYEEGVYKMYGVPVLMDVFSSKTPEQLALSSLMSENGHIDMHLNFVYKPDGKAILFASDYYRKAFPHVVSSLRKSLGAELYLVEDDYELHNGGINFPSLSDGKVIVGDRFPKIGRFLEDRLGKDNVLVWNLFGGESTIHGGLRCRTNLVDLAA